MYTIKAVFFFLLFSCTIFSAHSAIRVGTVFLYPPFVMSVNEGFDIEFVNLLCQRMKTDCTLIPMDFNKLFSALDNDVIDIAIGGIVISKAREQQYVFSLPYMLSKGEFLVLKDNKASSIDELAQQTIGVMKGAQASNVYSNFLNVNYPGVFKFQDFNDIEDLVSALRNQTIAAAFVHESAAYYWEQNGGGQFKMLGKPMSVGLGVGIMSTPKNISIIQQLNQQIVDIEQDGAFVSLYQEYFGNEQN
ncbi:transporter substrate-binding domain-containing protein [Legionella jamestowniensis]|uniref:Arginine-binding periplasmic protein n=1 Tax=Legionella jamestowniensis TaxID=455 RepID=A0A0W0UIZ5_9GAMM|nr:transporter substrate-binding domain-containing protein [Legionella jamestowniensis]KTD07872.1 arginine-binding periplasmic protein [Legionella jamestowniensis]SFL63462.1 arginine transport system substrate-binding protein [Legionella jamestowniensis DSM 19215]